MLKNALSGVYMPFLLGDFSLLLSRLPFVRVGSGSCKLLLFLSEVHGAHRCDVSASVSRIMQLLL